MSRLTIQLEEAWAVLQSDLFHGDLKYMIMQLKCEWNVCREAPRIRRPPPNSTVGRSLRSDATKQRKKSLTSTVRPLLIASNDYQGSRLCESTLVKNCS